MPLLVLPTRGTQLPGGRIPAALVAAGAIEVGAAAGPDEAWDSRVCAGIALAESVEPAIATQPLRLLSLGDAALSLPAVARANRAARRTIAEYALVEPDMPPTSDAWPDAPVIVFSDDPSTVSVTRLRGWEVRDPADLVEWIVEAGD